MDAVPGVNPARESVHLPHAINTLSAHFLDSWFHSYSNFCNLQWHLHAWVGVREGPASSWQCCWQHIWRYALRFCQWDILEESNICEICKECLTQTWMDQRIVLVSFLNTVGLVNLLCLCLYNINKHDKLTDTLTN